MADLVPPSSKDRKIRVHCKSRRGCGNCKLRKIKCDEGKPGCKRCAVYSIFCNYDGKHSDLQLSVDGVSNIERPQTVPQSQTTAISSVIAPSLARQLMATSNSNEFCQLDGKELELLDRFLTRTVFSITPAKTICLYENEIFKLTCIYPFLMHAALMVTLLHDRHLATVANTNPTAAEAFHYYQGTALFNSKLSGPLQGFERDALWVAAAILGTISFCYIEAKTPEEAWPLKPSSSLDLNWLTLSEGKMQVWEITQVIARPDSIFRELALEHKDFSMTAPGGPGLEALPYGFTAFYNLNATSTVDNNPYYAAALSVAQSMHLTCDYTTNMRFMMFIMKMQIEYKQLLLRKDPRALLLLAYWYAKVCQFEHWWFLGRATLECQAICIFLDRFHGDDANIQALLQFPRTIFTRSAWKSALEDLSPDMMDEVGVLP